MWRVGSEKGDGGGMRGGGIDVAKGTARRRAETRRKGGAYREKDVRAKD